MGRVLHDYLYFERHGGDFFIGLPAAYGRNELIAYNFRFGIGPKYTTRPTYFYSHGDEYFINHTKTTFYLQ